MICQKCQSDLVAHVSAKCSDCCHISLKDAEKIGYMPNNLGIGGGDYIDLKWCLNCGQIQGKFPKDPFEFLEDNAED